MPDEKEKKDAKDIYDKMLLMDRLEKAYAIIADFAGIVRDEIEKKNNSIALSSSCQGLESALGYIGCALDSLNCGDLAPDGLSYKKLAVSAPATRKKLSDAYLACDLVGRNLNAGSQLQDPLAYIESCLYAITEMTYRDASEVQPAMSRILGICDNALEAIDTIETIPPGECAGEYLNPGGHTLHARCGQLRELFDGFRPTNQNAGKDDCHGKGQDEA